MKLIFNYDTDSKQLTLINDKGEVFDNVTSISMYESMDPEKAGQFDCYISKRELEDGMTVYETYSCVASKQDKASEAIKNIFKKV